MLSAYSQVCFAVLLAVFCHAEALARSHHNNTLENHGFGNETRCSWKCKVIESDLTEEIKITIAKGKLIQLVVKYENKVDDKCVNQTSRDSSGNATEQRQIWLVNKQLSTFAKIMRNLENLMLDTASNEERKEISVLCTLRPSGTTATTPEYNGGIQFPMFSRGHLAALGVELNTTDFNTEETENLQSCINITNSTDNNGTDSKSPFEPGVWPLAVLYGFCFVFWAVFVQYSPAFLCLFSPTEVTEDGVRHIVLEGASPVCFRSLIGNYFFSEDDGTIWHKARTFIFRVVIIPLPLLSLAISADLKIPIFSGYSLSFFTMMLIQAKPCSVCKYVRPKVFSCQDELPLLILGHLRLQPLVFVKWWRLFTQYMSHYFKMSLILFPSSKDSFVYYFLRFSISIVFLSTVPPVSVMLFISILLLASIGIVFSSPIVMLCKASYSAINVPFFIVYTMRYYVSSLATGGLLVMLALAGCGALMALLSGMKLLFSDESLPYVACIVLVLYYVWSSYSSFTNNYQDLAFALFKHYKKSRHDKFVAMAVNTDQVQVNITDYGDDVMKIPKKLFHMACEELMPIREGFCKMILKIIIIASFVFLVFSITMLRSGGATPVMKALFTFLTGLFPKILAIYIDGGRHKKIEAMVTDEKIPKILHEYIKKTTGTTRFNQRQENSGADGDEVIFLNDNEENIALINI